VADVLRKGNMGLGTLNGLDGEVRRNTCWYDLWFTSTMLLYEAASTGELGTLNGPGHA
jgi:hypothetical protein